MTIRSSPSKIRHVAALFIRKILSRIIVPLTGFLQRLDLSEQKDRQTRYHCILHQVVHFLSWFCQGSITLAYPCMGYNPIKSRQQESSRKWAAEILNQSSSQLEVDAKNFLFTTQQISSTNFSSPPPSFTVLICFHHHLQFFKSCIESVTTACRHSPTTQVEILIVNDDPSIDSKQLLQEAGEALGEKIVFHTNKNNLGICQSTNQAIERARGEWILHLDCDDRLQSNVFSVLAQTIQKNPTIRFISSRAIDIDEHGNILSWRLRSEKTSDLIVNNFANHLKAIKKNIHADLGIFNSTFEGCQDYEFALRTAINEPLLFIPDYLYQYRWHDRSQTVSHNKRQNLTAARIRQTYLLVIHWLIHGTKIIQWNITGPFTEEWKKSLYPPSSLEKRKAPPLQDSLDPEIEKLPKDRRANCMNGCKSLPINPTLGVENNESQLNTAEKARYNVSLEATHPLNETQRRLLLIQIATIIIDRHHEKSSDREIAASDLKTVMGVRKLT
ncbi:MAG: glycosyltransferase [Chthoniobacterales bacterium]